MAKENLFLKEMKERGLIDHREVAAMADVFCTNGNGGRAFVLLSGTTLHLYAAAGIAALGDLIEVIDLRDASFLKGSTFPLHTSMKLQYRGNTYSFRGFTQAAKFIGAIKESCGA